MLSNDDLVVLVRREIDAALGYDDDTLAANRAGALSYYHGRAKEAPAGRSQFVSHDVADTVHALLAQVNPMFNSSLVQFQPETEEDEPQAQLESDYVKYMLEMSGGDKILSSAAHDALLISNGWIKVEVDEESTTTTENYGELDALQLQSLEAPTQENQVVETAETDKGYRIKRTTTVNKLVIKSKSPEVMLFSNDYGQFGYDELRFVGERVLFTNADLKGMGLSKQDRESIPESEDDYWPAVRARQGAYADENEDDGGKQTAEELKECFDVYMRVDMNENGSSELRHIIIGGTVLIKDEPAKVIPYATGSPVPLPHRVTGTGMFDLMFQVQDAKTHTIRQYLDNLSVMNQSRIGVVEGNVNLSDLTNGRVNGIVRMKSPDSIVPLPAADIGQQAITGLNYLDTVRSQRGGAAVDNNDADRQLMMSSATAAAGAVESAERMAGWYCHNLVNTLLKDLYKLIHITLRTGMPGKVNAKLRGKWTETDPSQWNERNHIEVNAGLTSSERAQRLQSLTMLVQQQTAAMQMGGEGIITDKGKAYNAMSDWIRASDIGSVDEYLIDPDSEEAQQAQQQQSQQAQEQAAKQDQIQQAAFKLEQDKLTLDKYKIDKELEFKYAELGVDAEVQEAKITTDAMIKMETSMRKDEAVQQ